MQALRFETEPNFFIAAESWGDPAHKPVVLLHGGGQTRHSWGDSAKMLAQNGYYAVAYDARGHGDSSWSADGNYQIERLVSDLRAIIGQFETAPALVGASMGGLTALIAEGEASQTLASAIVLVDIAPKNAQKGVERIFAFMSANLHEGFASLQEAAQAVANYLPHRPKTTDHRRLEKNLRLRNGRWFWHWDPAMLKGWQRTTPDQQTQDEFRLFEAAKKIKCPTLIVRGGMSDVVTEKVMAEFLDAVPHVQSVSVAGAGHMVAGDSNHAFTNAVLAFLKDQYSAA